MPKVAFDIPSELLDIVTEFQKVEFCRDRAEAFRRLVSSSAKRWKAAREVPEAQAS